MKNFNKLYITFILLLTSLSATDKSYSFIGIQTSNSFVKGNLVPTVGIKYGLQTKKHRTSFNYNYGKNSNGSCQTLLAQIDTGILSNKFKDSLFKPYAGVSFGLMKIDKEGTTLNDKGYLYGINTGVAYIFNDALDFDLSYKYLRTSELKTVNEISDISLSMHYFY